MSDRSARGSSRGSQPSGEKRTYLQTDPNSTKEGYLDPYYSPSSRQARDSASSSVYSSNQSSSSSSKSAKKSVAKPVIIHHDEDAPKDRDSYKKTNDPRYYNNSYLDSGEPKNKDSMKKAYDSGYYKNSSYFKD